MMQPATTDGRRRDVEQAAAHLRGGREASEEDQQVAAPLDACSRATLRVDAGEEEHRHEHGGHRKSMALSTVKSRSAKIRTRISGSG